MHPGATVAGGVSAVPLNMDENRSALKFNRGDGPLIGVGAGGVTKRRHDDPHGVEVECGEVVRPDFSRW